MKSIKIAGKTFKLASRMKRLYAFFIDIALISAVQLAFLFLLSVVAFLLFNGMFDHTSSSDSQISVNISEKLLAGVGLGVFAPIFSIALWVFGLLFIDGFRNGQGIGKKLLSLQVVRLKDGKPCTFKDAFVRRFAGILQPLDFFWSFGSKRQRLGDKFAETAVVDSEPELEHTETEDSERVLEAAIAEMKGKLSEARQKVDASIGVEKQFQDAYEGAVAEVEKWRERAIIDLKAGREDLAREDIEKRNEYRRLAEQHKTQWEQQKHVVQALSDLLEHLQQKMMEAEGKKTVVVAQHRNVDAEAHLREMLKELQDSKAFETLTKMEQDATEAATLAQTAAKVDIEYQDTKLEREFSSYAKEASIDKDLAELKAKLQ
ncbi:MAG: PspA/IM30 family protein [Candidatus Poribacteria bacterium]|nr:PspA/IM30 family protein [Candidatus Poribacteria bacterium]